MFKVTIIAIVAVNHRSMQFLPDNIFSHPHISKILEVAMIIAPPCTKIDISQSIYFFSYLNILTQRMQDRYEK